MNRRQFLKASAALGAGALLPMPEIPRSANLNEERDDRLRSPMIEHVIDCQKQFGYTMEDGLQTFDFIACHPVGGWRNRSYARIYDNHDFEPFLSFHTEDVAFSPPPFAERSAVRRIDSVFRKFGGHFGCREMHEWAWQLHTKHPETAVALIAEVMSAWGSAAESYKFLEVRKPQIEAVLDAGGDSTDLFEACSFRSGPLFIEMGVSCAGLDWSEELHRYQCDIWECDLTRHAWSFLRDVLEKNSISSKFKGAPFSGKDEQYGFESISFDAGRDAGEALRMCRHVQRLVDDSLLRADELMEKWREKEVVIAKKPPTREELLEQLPLFRSQIGRMQP